MSVETHFYNWGLLADPATPKYHTCSPNLICLGNYLGKRFAMTNNGCYGQRPIRGGTTPSVHWWGAATDRNYPDRLTAKNVIIPFLIDNSHELHVQAIHDYFGSRIWRAGRTSSVADAHTSWWKTNTTAEGMGDAWATYFHIETNPEGWGDAVDISARLGLAPPPVNPPPLPPSGVAIVFPRVIKPGMEGPDVAMVQTVIRAPGAVGGSKTIIVDGKYGAQTVTAVKNIQTAFKLTPDGIIGPQTQAVFIQLANS
jgi:hypothetical protein